MIPDTRFNSLPPMNETDCSNTLPQNTMEMLEQIRCMSQHDYTYESYAASGQSINVVGMRRDIKYLLGLLDDILKYSPDIRSALEKEEI